MSDLNDEAKKELANEATRVLRDPRTSYWPRRTGLSLRGWRVKSVDDRGFTVENPANYAIFVEAKNHTYKGGGRVRLPALSTIRDNLEYIVRRVSGNLENSRSGD